MPEPVRGARFLQENAVALAQLAVAGFAVRYVGNDLLASPASCQAFLRHLVELVRAVPTDRAFLVIDALNDLHPDSEMLKAVTENMRRWM